MDRIYDYQRKYNINRIPDRLLDLGNAGSFMEIRPRQCTPPEECLVDNTAFRSLHIIEQRNGARIFTAYKSVEDPGILLIVWGGFTFYPHIEEGGDYMLQILAADKTIRHLIVDNTYVRSGWMEDRMHDYLNKAWFPGLVELELNTVCYLQAESILGRLSFNKFADDVSKNINKIAQNLGKKPFKYCEIQTSDISPGGKIDDRVRDLALKKACSIVKTF